MGVARPASWTNATPVTVAGSPLVGAWVDVSGYANVMPSFSFAGGTSTHSLEWSLDGVTVDPDFTSAAPVSLTAQPVIAPYVRWRTVQTVADATKSKVALMAR